MHNSFTMNILCWNAKGLGTPQKHSILHDIIKDHNINIIVFQQIEKETFTKRMLLLMLNLTFGCANPLWGHLEVYFLGVTSVNFKKILL
jgi:hypothetical protein